MTAKILGAIFVVIACGGIGWTLAGIRMREIRYLRSLIHALELMRCELEYRMTPLPKLCEMVGEQNCDMIGRWFDKLGQLLARQEIPGIDRCMEEMADQVPIYYPHITEALDQLCRSLGRFDLSGQLNSINGVTIRCKSELDRLTEGADQRTRSIRTLGLCTGTALAILLM